ncbi:leucine rich repeat containing G protein-coupled receptor chaoptin isoform X3 [Lasioglossum baleicum]|uniref:leucine rich repeat containing G protein-coupled receptor chaoptin isoform X3 n=1 Tax=Lasioglossum baleicum TaxID=434251 RepID=UPI003FCC7723
MNLLTMVKVGYVLVFVTLLLMMWASVVRMHELPVQYPPCFFNPLCTCSKAIPDLGIVTCYDVPMPRIPQPINSSKVFMLQLENNGLMFLQQQFLMNTGLYNLRIKHNPLADIPDEAFLGLERSLWELELPYNRLERVPSRSFRHLQKLQLLDLTGNKISKIAADNWRGLENSLQKLRLGRNAIDRLPADAFAGLTYLDMLDLRDNNLKEIDPSVFRDGMAHLVHLYLNGNQLTHIPYAQLSALKQMKVLDLSFNRISRMLNTQQEPEIRGLQMSLDTLRLDYNQLEMLMPGDFQHFYKVNRTYLDGNPLSMIEEGTFRDSKIRELYFSDCDLMDVSSANFVGLESSLELLDLSGNNITTLPSPIFQEYDFLRTLIFRENKIQTIQPAEVFNGFQYSLYNLDLSGKENSVVSLQDLRQMRNMRLLSLSRMPQSTLSPEDFMEYGMDVKELRIMKSNLNTIKSHAFMHVRGIKYIDFSENAISSIENEAFSEVGHSLLTLRMSHGLSSSFSELPNAPFKFLTSLQHLDFSNNKIKSMPDTSFHFMKRIKRIELQDNEIDNIRKGTFQGDIHSSLEDVNFAYNMIKTIQTHTFVDLPRLTTINLEDNAIERIERRGFMNMKLLKYINLRGNKIKDITDEAFQNLPDLKFLDLAYNDLTEFDFASFDQVGTLSTFKVNASHNEIPKLWINSTTFTPPTTIGGSIQSNIKVIDFSYNNISDIMKYYFKPVEYSLTHLYLSHNQLMNVTQGIFGNMPHLQWLDLSHNELTEIDFDSFRNTKNIQVLSLAWNNILEIPSEALKPLKKLRIVDLSHNRLKALPDNIFADANIESLDLSHNQFMRLPIKSMSLSSTSSLSMLDMSWNTLSGIHTTDAIFRLRSLTWLDLSYNRLVRLDDGVFSDMHHLSHLDLSHNKQLLLESRGRTFHGLEDSLLYLDLSNISLLSVPDLPLRRLQTLYLAHNELASIPPEMASNLTSLHYLDLSANDLTVVPLITHTLPELKTFSLADNPITAVTNTSFLGIADSLEELDIRRLALSTFESGALCKATKLRKLHITAYNGVKNFNFPNILEYNHGLRHLVIDVQNDTDLEKEMKGRFPYKLFNITLTGQALKNINTEILHGIRSPHLHFGMFNTSVSTVPKKMFDNAEWVRNVTIHVHHSDVRTLHNPSNGYKPGVPGKRFLLRLTVRGNYFTCDCDIGWMETWQRKHRQYQEDRCSTFSEFKNFERNEEDDVFDCWNNEWDDDLRESFCLNKNNVSVLEALKTDLECGWGAASYVRAPRLVALLLSVVLAAAIY